MIEFLFILSITAGIVSMGLSSHDSEIERYMFIEVTKADYLDGYRVKLLFNNGETKIADLSQSLNGAVFAPLKDIEFFKRFTIKFNTIEWENGADFAPEYLYEIGVAA